MRVTIIRHGETSHNVRKVFSGSQEADLTDAGIAQARALAIRLKDEKFDLAISSDLERARKTLQFAIGHENFIVSKYLRERSFGEFEGKPYTDMDAALEGSGQALQHFRPIGGESYFDVEQRIALLWQEHLVGFSGSVILSAHGSINRTLLRWFLGLSFEEQHTLHQANTCINILEGNEPGTFKALLLNCTVHLQK